LAEQFTYIFERLINREKIEPYEEELSLLFAVISQSLIDYPLRFEGLSYLTSKIRKSRQIVFEGNIVAEEDYGEWNDRIEPFNAIVTDKRITKQGIWIKIWVGEYVGEGELSEALP
jgi:hypothetical protein